jgi:SAM-dependent methyltransferase
MNTFSADWLSLRESVDHRSRNSLLQEKVINYLHQIADSKDGPVQIVDLGSGTGSNLRALAPLIHRNQQWTLIDYDPLLLNSARQKLCAWADSTIPDVQKNDADDFTTVEPLTLIKNQHQITVDFLQSDLAKNLPAVLSRPADLITAAAFFDLVAFDWLDQFCKLLQSPLYTVLTYNGEERWLPEDPSDSEILKAFHAHQSRDKGFGPAAGPLALGVLEQLLTQRGFKLEAGTSPWMLGVNDSSLIAELARSTAQAAAETKLVSHETSEKWGMHRSQSHRCEIGHDDLFAIC